MGRVKSAENAILYYEGGQTFVPMTALSNSGDNQIFESGNSYWSGAGGKEPVVRPDGLVSGGAITPKSGANDTVSVAALTCYLAGELKSVAAGDVSVTRGIDPDVHIINSIIVDSDGALDVVTGTASDAFSEARGAAGGPPYIPAGAIEIGQVRLTSGTAAEVTAAEIFTVPGTHRELWNYPLWDEDMLNGSVHFYSPLPAIHTGDTTKGVYAQYYLPIFVEVPNTSDFVAPENSHSVSSEQVYGGTIATSSSSLGQGSFTARLQSGVSDSLLAAKDDVCWFKFYPDRLKTEHIVCQGKLGIARTFPVSGSIQASCTISASNAAQEVAS